MILGSVLSGPRCPIIDNQFRDSSCVPPIPEQTPCAVFVVCAVVLSRGHEAHVFLSGGDCGADLSGLGHGASRIDGPATRVAGRQAHPR